MTDVTPTLGASEKDDRIELDAADIDTLDKLLADRQHDAGFYGAMQFQGGMSDARLEMAKHIEVKARREAALLQKLLTHFRGY